MYCIRKQSSDRIFLVPRRLSPDDGGEVKLVVESETQAVEEARSLIERTREQLTDGRLQLQRELIDLIERIIIYKFPQSGMTPMMTYAPILLG